MRSPKRSRHRRERANAILEDEFAVLFMTDEGYSDDYYSSLVLSDEEEDHDWVGCDSCDSDCSICLDSCEGAGCVVTACSHYFHGKCLKAALSWKSLCPNCRRELC